MYMIATPVIFAALLIGALWLAFTGTDLFTGSDTIEVSTQTIELHSIQDFNTFESIDIEIGGTTIHAELAVTSLERIRGLSGKTSLEQNEGLLFVFPHDSAHGIWMKDMHFPIDVVWLDSDFVVVDLEENARPESFPDEVYRPERDARYVLEVPTGTIRASGIKINTQARIVGVEEKPERLQKKEMLLEDIENRLL